VAPSVRRSRHAIDTLCRSPSASGVWQSRIIPSGSQPRMGSIMVSPFRWRSPAAKSGTGGASISCLNGAKAVEGFVNLLRPDRHRATHYAGAGRQREFEDAANHDDRLRLVTDLSPHKFERFGAPDK